MYKQVVGSAHIIIIINYLFSLLSHANVHVVFFLQPCQAYKS